MIFELNLFSFALEQDQTFTKIPRFDGAVATSKIARPKTGFARPTTAIPRVSQMAKPGFGLRQVQSASAATTTVKVDGTARSATQVSQMQRKTMLRRMNSNNNKAQLTNQVPKVTATENDKRTTAAAVCETTVTVKGEFARGHDQEQPRVGDLNATNTLIRSGTFVCESSDETQAKLLSLTHNINTPPTELKERTYKRSLSPIYAETAKRKHLQKISVEFGGDKNRKANGPMLISTPRLSIGNERNLPFFTGQKANREAKAYAESPTMDNTILMMENDYAPSPAGVESSRVTASQMFNIPESPPRDDKESKSVEMEKTLIEEPSAVERIEDQEIDLVDATGHGELISRQRFLAFRCFHFLFSFSISFYDRSNSNIISSSNDRGDDCAKRRSVNETLFTRLRSHRMHFGLFN